MLAEKLVHSGTWFVTAPLATIVLSYNCQLTRQGAGGKACTCTSANTHGDEDGPALILYTARSGVIYRNPRPKSRLLRIVRYLLCQWTWIGNAQPDQ